MPWWNNPFSILRCFLLNQLAPLKRGNDRCITQLQLSDVKHSSRVGARVKMTDDSRKSAFYALEAIQWIACKLEHRSLYFRLMLSAIQSWLFFQLALYDMQLWCARVQWYPSIQHANSEWSNHSSVLLFATHSTRLKLEANAIQCHH